jgi:hypothetical protein
MTTSIGVKFLFKNLVYHAFFARLLPEVDVWVSRVQKESVRHGQPYGNSDDTWAVVEPLVIVSLDHSVAQQSDGGAHGMLP